MLQSFKILSRQSVIYGLGSILNKLLAFVLLPIYTRYLTPADYGVLSLLLVTGSVAGIIAQFGLGSALFREVIYCESDERVTVSTALYFMLVESLALFGGLAIFARPLSFLIFGSAAFAHLLRLICYTGLLRIVETVFMAKLRIRERASLYSALSVAQFLVGAGLNIYFIVVLRRGVEGLVMAGLIQAGLFSGVYLAILAPSLKPALSLSILRSLLRFGVPLVPAGLAGLVMVSADRYFLQHYSTTTEVGLYSLGYTIGLVVSLIVTSVQLAWPAQMFTIAKQSDAERQFSTILTYYAVVLGFIGLSVSVLAHEVLMAMATPNFYGAAAVVPVIVVSYIFHGFRYMTNTGLSTKNKMKYVPPMIIGAALLNLGLNFILIPTYGMMGAAWATLISYIVLAVVSMVVNLHFWSIPYEYGRMVKVALAWGTVYGLSKLLPFTDVWASSGSKLLLLATYPVFLYLFRFFQRHELERLKALLKRMVGRV